MILLPADAIFSVSQVAQKLAPVLEFLRQHTGLALQVVLHPEPELSDLPLKSYYRFALPEFAHEGARYVTVVALGCSRSLLNQTQQWASIHLSVASSVC